MKAKVINSHRKNNPVIKAYSKAVKAGQHVVPSSDGWKVKKANSEKATKIFSTQKEAIEHARKTAINQQTELFIHGRNGQIRERNSYGNDSFPPRG